MPGHALADEPYYDLVGEGHAFAHPPGVEDFEDQLGHSLSSLEHGEPNIIFDRCPVDFLAYLAVLEGDLTDLIQRWHERVRPAMDSLDAVILVPVGAPDRIAMADSTDPDGNRVVVGEILRDLLLSGTLDLDVEVLEVRGPLRVRERAALQWLGVSLAGGVARSGK